MKYKLTETEYKELPEHFQKEYAKNGDSFFLDVEGGVDVKSLHDLYTASIQNQPISTASAEDNNQHFFS